MIIVACANVNDRRYYSADGRKLSTIFVIDRDSETGRGSAYGYASWFLLRRISMP